MQNPYTIFFPSWNSKTYFLSVAFLKVGFIWEKLLSTKDFALITTLISIVRQAIGPFALLTIVLFDMAYYLPFEFGRQATSNSPIVKLP